MGYTTPFTTSVIKGAINEYILCIIFYGQTQYASSEYPVWKQTINLSAWDYIRYSVEIKCSNTIADYVYFRIYIDDTLIVEVKTDDTSQFIQKSGYVDVSAYSGDHQIRVVATGYDGDARCLYKNFCLIGSEA